jgi:hypothetical protein
MGRKQIEISRSDFENLCAIWCTLEDIAGWFDCSADTIERWCKRTYQATFAETYKKKSAKGAVSLRRKQFELAQKGNVGLLIWLGKQHLGQREPHFIAPVVPLPIDGKAEIVIRWVDEDQTGDATQNATTKKV